MDSHLLVLAGEFCKVAGKPNLVEYLGLRPGCSGEEAQEQLKKKRKYMQGMQSNPKYKNEALLLIKNFSSFQQLLQQPADYLAKVREQEASAHLPVLEMTIRGSLRGGALSPEQVDYLRRNASQLGVGDALFSETLARLCQEAGFPLPGAPVDASDSPPPSRRRNTDEPAAAQPLRRTRSSNSQTIVPSMSPFQGIDLSEEDPAELARRVTAPPARDRETTDPQGFLPAPQDAPTAPPVRQRVSSPRQSQELSSAETQTRRVPLTLHGPSLHEIEVGAAPALLVIRSVLDPGTGARAVTDAPWLTVRPSHSEAGRGEIEWSLQIDPATLPDGGGRGTLTVLTDRGEQQSIAVHAARAQEDAPQDAPRYALAVAAIAIAGGLVAIAAGWLLLTVLGGS